MRKNLILDETGDLEFKSSIQEISKYKMFWLLVLLYLVLSSWTWAGSPMWARLNPAHIPKEVEAVVLETTALNCPCTLNEHERDGHEGIKKYVLQKQKNIKKIFAQKSKRVFGLWKKFQF